MTYPLDDIGAAEFIESQINLTGCALLHEGRLIATGMAFPQPACNKFPMGSYLVHGKHIDKRFVRIIKPAG